MQLESTAFGDSEPIPTEFTGDGADKSPPLRWSDPPPETKELALLCEDPDAPQTEPFVHWIAYKIPPETKELPEGLPHEPMLNRPAPIVQGINSFRNAGYGGPLPPRRHGPHRYFFKLFALDKPLNLPPGAQKSEFLNAIKGHVVGEAQLMGTYERH
jgi:Raf kinase inhibitor-like YbhB/YbcL family protein